mgnify:CR=1 FL=1
MMEQADDIMASMGLADSVPLSEATSESLDSVGKSYGEELPELSDDQRNALLEHSLGEGKVKDLSIRAEEGDPKAINALASLGKKPPKRKGTPKILRKARKRHNAGKPLKKGTALAVAKDPNAGLDAATAAGNKLSKPPFDHKAATKRNLRRSEGTTVGSTRFTTNSTNAKELQNDHMEPTILGKALSEMTSIGMIGTNSGGANHTWKPGKKKKKKKKKGKKSSSKFINFELGKI